MSDRELLTKVARLTGIPDVEWNDGKEPYSSGEGFVLIDNSVWNPLTSDGDALRLAVRLGLWIASDNNLGQSFVADDPEGGGRVALIEWHSAWPSPCAATRRAIVRAAAALADSILSQGTP